MGEEKVAVATQAVTEQAAAGQVAAGQEPHGALPVADAAQVGDESSADTAIGVASVVGVAPVAGASSSGDTGDVDSAPPAPHLAVPDALEPLLAPALAASATPIIAPPAPLEATAPTGLTLYPALDLLNGQCVRLLRDADGQATVLADDPIAVARRWQAAGATWLHVVDLDGAREGGVRQAATLRAIVEATGLRIQFGGGMQREEDVAAAFAAGAARVTLATAVVRDVASGEALLRACLARWGERIAVAVDAHDGQITAGGWLPWATGSATDFAQAMALLGVRTLVVTNLDPTDTLIPSMNGAESLLAELRATLPEVALIAAGGVGSLDDLRRLARLSVTGVVIGRALYDGALDLAEALAVAAHLDAADPDAPDQRVAIGNSPAEAPDAPTLAPVALPVVVELDL